MVPVVNKLLVSAVAVTAVIGAIWALPGAVPQGSVAQQPSPAALIPNAMGSMTATHEQPLPAGIVTVPDLAGSPVVGTTVATRPGAGSVPATTNTVRVRPSPAASPSARTGAGSTVAAAGGQTAAATTAQPTTSRPSASQPAPATSTAGTSSATSAMTTSHPAPTPAPARAAPMPKRTAPKPVRTPTPTTAKPVPAPHFGIPVTVGNAGQIVTVTAASSSSTVGSLAAWQRHADGSWSRAFGPLTAHLGSDGVGAPSEYSSHTPQGTWTMTQAFGRLSNPGTSLPYTKVSTQDWWVSDVNSADYNTHQVCSAGNCPFDTGAGENLYNAGPVYNYAVVMDVNRWPASRGGGSAYFLHVTDGGPTAGCVSIDAGALASIMQWLRPASHPRIAVGIG